jgi:hypothetical protein
MPWTVLGVIASLRLLYLAARPSNVVIDVDGLANPLHRPTICSRQTRGQGFLSGAALSHCAAVGCGAFSGDVRIFDR